MTTYQPPIQVINMISPSKQHNPLNTNNLHQLVTLQKPKNLTPQRTPLLPHVVRSLPPLCQSVFHPRLLPSALFRVLRVVRGFPPPLPLLRCPFIQTALQNHASHASRYLQSRTTTAPRTAARGALRGLARLR